MDGFDSLILAYWEALFMEFLACMDLWTMGLYACMDWSLIEALSVISLTKAGMSSDILDFLQSSPPLVTWMDWLRTDLGFLLIVLTLLGSSTSGMLKSRLGALMD